MRHAALRALLNQQDDGQLHSWMLKRVQNDSSESSLPLVAILLAAAGDAQDILDHLNKVFKANPSKLVSMISVVEVLGGWPDPAAVRGLKNVTRLDAFPKALGLKRAVAKALIDIPLKDSVPTLIDLMGSAEGELVTPIGDYLNKISGESYAADNSSWKQWWQKNGDSFSYPSFTAVLADRDPRMGRDLPRFYGMPITAKRLIFVIDTSGSMAGAKIQNAKKELMQAIQNLPPKTEFNLIVFNSKVYVWSSRLVEATEDAKNRALNHVNGLPVGGETATYDALLVALEMRVEAIYLLTDGQPTKGKIVRPDAIAAAIRTQNRLQGSSINTIGLGTGPDFTVFSRFLQALAAQNHGLYRKVN
jgi:hypothetical protein